jgi:hypothetical protein
VTLPLSTYGDHEALAYLDQRVAELSDWRDQARLALDGPVRKLARPEGLEPPAYRFEACRSIQLSYGRVRS